MNTKLKYGKKDGITGIKKGRYANMPESYYNPSEREIDEMLHRIELRRKDPLHFFSVLTWQGGKWR
jgi:hypothetical protein